jgi:hypothetical protein
MRTTSSRVARMRVGSRTPWYRARAQHGRQRPRAQWRRSGWQVGLTATPTPTGPRGWLRRGHSRPRRPRRRPAPARPRWPRRQPRSSSTPDHDGDPALASLPDAIPGPAVLPAIPAGPQPVSPRPDHQRARLVTVPVEQDGRVPPVQRLCPRLRPSPRLDEPQLHEPVAEGSVEAVVDRPVRLRWLVHRPARDVDREPVATPLALAPSHQPGTVRTGLP